MWILEDLSKGTTYVLPCNKSISIGRKSVDVVISGDSSVSRNHATIRIVHSAEDVKKANGVGEVKLEDSSKFGTTVKKGSNRPADIKVKECCELKPNDRIEFGVQGSVFKLSKRNFNVASSMLDSATKADLQEALKCIGGNFINNWHCDVTHLVVQGFKLNVKAVRALVNQCHIVTPAFVLNLKQEIATNLDKVVIEPGKYLPAFDEPSLSVANSCLLLNVGRKSVFSGKKFVFLDEKQFKRMGPVVSSGGGEVLQTVDVDMLVSASNTCFVKPSKSTEVKLIVSTAKIAGIQNELSRAGRRMIEEYEIGLAVLYCDSSVYCNSVFDLNSQNAYTQATVAESQKESLTVLTPGDVDKRAVKKESNQQDQKYPEVLQPSDSLKLPQYSECETLEKEDMEVDDKNTVKTRVAAFAEHVAKSNTSPQETFDLKEPSLPITARVSTEINPVSSIPQRNKLPGSDVQKTCSLEKNSLPTTRRASTVMDSVSSIPQINKVPSTNVKVSSSSVPSWTAKESTSAQTSDSHDLFEKHERSSSATKVSKQQVEPFVTFATRQASPSLVVEKGLLARRKRPHEPDIVIGVKNFKRFRKVWPTYMSVHMSCSTVPSCPTVPRIIGGSDLFVNGEVEDIQFASQTRRFAESQDSNPFLCS